MKLSQTKKQSFVYRFGSVKYDFSSRTHLVGILNVTPDSFSDGGKFYDVDSAVRHALQMVEEGADIIDIGGESTRPGSKPISVEEELRRVLPVIQRLVETIYVPISIDTYKSAVARKVLEAGAFIVNDISGLRFDPEMIDVIAEHKASVIVVHIKGTPQTMQQNPVYEDVMKEIKEYLQESISLAEKRGIQQIIIDPGIGFGKTLQHNLEIFRQLSEFGELNRPILAGPSRKSFIGAILNTPVDDRLEGTAAAVAVSIMNGAHLVRVHDVMTMKRIAKVTDAIVKGENHH